MTRSLDMGDLTWPELAAAISNGAGVILPVGATEQHGPHLPLCTDALLATELARAVAAESNLFVAPAISYGYRSRPQVGGGQGFIGTTSLSGVTLINQVTDVLSEFIRHGFRRICVLNWHMENTNFLYEAAFLAKQNDTSDSKILVIESPFDELSQKTMDILFEGDFPGWAIEHAGILETSLLQYLHPDLVREEKIEDGQAPRRVSYDVLPLQEDLVSPNGALWKATLGSAEKGKQTWNEIVPPLVNAVLRELPVDKTLI
jgi:creatinine amidohydrolase